MQRPLGLFEASFLVTPAAELSFLTLGDELSVREAAFGAFEAVVGGLVVTMRIRGLFSAPRQEVSSARMYLVNI